MSKSQHRRPDDDWPLIQIKVPGDRSYRVRGLMGPKQAPNKPFDISLKASGSGHVATIRPGLVAGGDRCFQIHQPQLGVEPLHPGQALPPRR